MLGQTLKGRELIDGQCWGQGGNFGWIFRLSLEKYHLRKDLKDVSGWRCGD